MNAPRELHEELLASVRRWSRGHLDAASTEAAKTVAPELRTQLADLGLFSITIPEEYDGTNLGLPVACEIVEELARHDRSVATMVGLHLGLGTRAIVRGARPELAARWLPRLARGEMIGAFAATEPNAGSDLGSIRTTLDLEGAEARLDGEKAYVTNARFAGCFTVLARTGRSHTLVLVPADTAGVSIDGEEDKLGIRASSTATVRFDGVRLPKDHVLGEPGRGLELAYEVLGWGRTVMAAGCSGTLRDATDRTLAHVTTRRQFKRLLIAFPAVQSAVANLRTMSDVTSAMVARTARLLERGAGESPSIATKVFASEQAFFGCDAAIQLHGALGVIETMGVARLARDCRVTRIFEGANDVLLVRLGTALLAGAGGCERVGSAARPNDAARVDAMAEAIDGAIAAVRKRHGVTAIHRQGILVALARAEVAHQAAIAAVTHPEAMVRERLDFALAAFEGDVRARLDEVGRADDLAERAARACADLTAVPSTPTGPSPLELS